MKRFFFGTSSNWTGVFLRLTIGLVLFPHGAQKMLGVFGGYGFTGTMDYFTNFLHLPWLLGFLVILIEFVGSLLLIAGFAGRLSAAFVIVLMTGIVFTSHIHNGFFMNWLGNQKGEGFEYHLLMIGLSLSLLANGSGKYSVDLLLSQKGFDKR